MFKSWWYFYNMIKVNKKKIMKTFLFSKFFKKHEINIEQGFSLP
jgi:hypothetical protein